MTLKNLLYATLAAASLASCTPTLQSTQFSSQNTAKQWKDLGVQNTARAQEHAQDLAELATYQQVTSKNIEEYLALLDQGVSPNHFEFLPSNYAKEIFVYAEEHAPLDTSLFEQTGPFYAVSEEWAENNPLFNTSIEELKQKINAKLPAGSPYTSKHERDLMDKSERGKVGYHTNLDNIQSKHLLVLIDAYVNMVHNPETQEIMKTQMYGPYEAGGVVLPQSSTELRYVPLPSTQVDKTGYEAFPIDHLIKGFGMGH